MFTSPAIDVVAPRVFRPVTLGTPLDHNPVPFDELVRSAEQRAQRA